MSDPVLYIFAGLPGSGKSTIAQQLAQKLHCVYLRIDTIEQGLRDLCSFDVEGEGYRLAYRIASDNLRVGNAVIADSCNPITLTRREWETVGTEQGIRAINIEVICSDEVEHRHRVEGRAAEIEGLTLPTWEQVQKRVYDPWTTDRIRIDTASKTPEESLDELMASLTNVLA